MAKGKSANRRKKTKQQMYALAEKYLKSGCPQQQFCEQENIAVSSFQYWLRQYRRDHANNDKAGADFIPVQFAEEAPVQQPTSCTLQYPNGVKIKFSGKMDVQIIAQLINIQAD